MADEYINGVVSLLHFDGANGSTSFKDSASLSMWTPSGDAVISTEQSKFGGAAFYKAAAGNHCLSTPSTTDLNLGTYDFTIELWVYPLSLANWSFLLTKWGYANGVSGAFDRQGFAIGFMGDGSLLAACTYPSWGFDGVPNTIVTNQWQHLAFTRMGGVARIFVDGVLKHTWSNGSDMTNAQPVMVGGYDVEGNAFTGYIDEVRITKGQCKYFENFTPPTEPFDNPPQWWTAAPNLTPVAAWDASRVNGAQLLDGVGANDLTANADITDTVVYPNKGVLFNTANMTTPIPVPHGAGVVAGWISNYDNSGFGVIGTGQYQTMYFEGSDFFMDNYARQYFSPLAGDRSKPQFVAFVFRDTYGELYLDGQLVGDSRTANSYRGNGTYPILNYVLGSINMMQGSLKKYFHALAILTGNATLEDLRKLENAARAKLRYGGNTTYHSFASGIGRMAFPIPQHLLLSPIPPRFVGSTLTRRDYQFGGNGRIAGTVKEKGAPDTPLQRRVQLYDESSKIMTREVWSNLTTGAYLFENIDPKLTYTIISYDYTGMYRAVIANGQKATT